MIVPLAHHLKQFKSCAGRRIGWAILAGLLLATFSVHAASSTFTFFLDEPCKTSAGVFAPDGTLVRTLWSKVRYNAGTNSALWDGLDDSSNAVPAGAYEIKVLQHNTEYVWDGAIGNTSAEISGPTVHRGFYPMRDLAISGTNAFYVSGYNEGMYAFRNFLTTDPQRVKFSWYWVYSAQFKRTNNVPGDTHDLNWLWTAADARKVYFACSDTPDPANLKRPNSNPGCIVACNIGDNSAAYFPKGGPIINNGANSPLPNGLYVGSQAGLSGLTVQQNGSLLAASVAPDDKVYLLDKNSGAALGDFEVKSPGRLNFSPDGSLWVISGSSVICFTNVSGKFSPGLTISNFSAPLDVAVNPNNPKLVLVADGGGSQQVKAFNNAGASLWTYGLAGGYQSNGVAVATNKFWFFNGEMDGTFLCFAPDDSFWVGDGGNSRSLHFSADRKFIEQIAYQSHSYVACVDQNNPSRVFNQFLEFKVNYGRPLPQGWTLVNNWKANVDACHLSWNSGLREVTTFTNGRTYALIDNNCIGKALQELCELGSNSLRFVGVFPMINNQGRWISLGTDGSARATTIGSAKWFQATLKGFDAKNNPLWNPETLLASAPNGTNDPVPRCCSFGNIRATISSNNILISFDQSKNQGFHLGGIKVGSGKWLWRASPAASWMDGAGNYEIANGVQYAGNTVQALDRQVIFGYHGEFFRGQGQACQHMHFYDDGLFVGQFGEATPGHSAYEGVLPGVASNGHCPSLTQTHSGDYYVWVNDEGGHGPQRWHLLNAGNIRELTGRGNLGDPIKLTNQVYDFPSGVTAKSGNQTVQLSWLPVVGAAKYIVRYSQANGGPYPAIVTGTTNLNCLASGLTNGQTYYFVVTAVKAGEEGPPSEQVAGHPFDTTQNVLCAGSMAEGGQFTPIIDVASTNPATGKPSYVGSEQFSGTLNARELDYYGYGNLECDTFGTRGYAIYGYSGSGSTLASVSDAFTIAPGSGWGDLPFLERQFRVDNLLGTNSGWVATPLGSIKVTANDTNFHFLTVVSPAQFNNPRRFNLSLASPGSAPAVFSVNEPYGYSHVFQFKFRGSAVLWADARNGSGGIVQALFLDDAPVTYQAR